MISAFRQIAAAQNIIMAADMTGKIKTFVQDIAIIVLLVTCQLTGNIFIYFDYIGLGLLIFATVLSIISAVNYIVKNRQVLKN